VGREQEIPRLRSLAHALRGWDVRFVVGGENRQKSVANGLKSLFDASDNDLVLVHDAARPVVDAEIIGRCLEGARTYGMAVAALPVSDTLKAATPEGVVSRTVDRNGLWAMQTPQASTLGLLREAVAAAERDGFNGTDEASLVERLPGRQVHLVEGAPQNIKITTPVDARFAAGWLARPCSVAWRRIDPL
jgi:2-C-methyl-D-erythritol 4-phosphate cytidylyltransferase